MSAGRHIPPIATIAAAGLILAAAIVLRFGDGRASFVLRDRDPGANLAARAMHGDEAVNTVKFARLAGLPPHDDEPYRYDPHEFHGPVLPQLTVIARAVTGAETYAATDEAMYRSVTAGCGVAVVALTLLMGRYIGWGAALVAGLLCAVSPAMVFFSRYYIHETPLVMFSAAAILCAAAYAATRRWWWAIALGASVGAMHATKETFVLGVFAMAAACGLAIVAMRTDPRTSNEAYNTLLTTTRSLPRAVALALAAAAIVSVALFTGLGSNPRGAVDSILTYATWIGIGVEGGAGDHVHGFRFYLDRLFWHPFAKTLHVSEWLIAALAAAGVAAAVITRRPVAVAFAVFGPLLLLVYSVIPYKTPWSIMPAHHGLILLAGVGAAAIVRNTPTVYLKAALVVALLVGVGFMHAQNRLVNYVYPSDPRNPWVYAHTSSDLLKLVQRVEQVAAQTSDPARMTIRIVAGYEWPLPFYLRRFERVGYHRDAAALAESLGDKLPAVPLVIASIDQSDPFDAALIDTHQIEHFGHRPGVVLRVYIRRDLWDKFMATQK